MIRKLLGVPLKMVKRALGREEKPAAAPPPVRRPPPPRPAAAAPEGDHGHSHGGGGGHDHGHSHGGAPEPVSAPTPAPVEDHGHSHGGHSHGHSHGGEARAAAPAGEEVGLNIRVDESETPNPTARKYTCSIAVIETGSASFNTAEEANSHPLGRHIWALGGVKGIFAVKDFVTVTKRDDADWSSLSPRMATAVRRGLVERNATAS